VAGMSSPRFLLLPALLLVFAPAALAGNPKIDSKITYRNFVEPPMFIHEGEVKSELKKCERDRTVRLFGEGIKGSFGTDQTNADGEYRIEMEQDGIPSDYYTRVGKKEKAGVVCKADESPHKPLN
jgi:hypothetical protein